MKQWQAVITDYINQHVDSDICMIKVFNPEKIDKLILPLVLKMREAGFQTMGSCMGDVGHGTGMSCFTIPYVQCLPNVNENPWKTLQRLDKFLLGLGITAFSLNIEIHRPQGLSIINLHFPQYKPIPQF